MPLDEIYVTYLNGQSRGRLATVTPGGTPQDKPVGFRYNADLGTIDIIGFVGWNGRAAGDAADAAARLVDELQAGWDARDADITNRHFAADLLWGSPFGATVHGYEPLHAIHLRLKQQGRGGPASRFELVTVLCPAPGVALAQIRRAALGPDGQPVEPSHDLTGPFSEMVLYVLVRRGGTWWVAAGQNTPIQPPPGAGGT